MKIITEHRAIDKIYKRRDRYDIPEWQRQEVWSQSKKQNLIDSILRGWTVPKFYFLKTSAKPEEYDVVDGQQRLTAIFEFFDNALPLADNSAKLFGGTYYRDLPDELVDAFDDYEIQFDSIEDASDEDIKLFFQRLQEGLPLTSSEKLNAVPSKLRDFVTRSAAHGFFKKTTTSNRRYGYFDIVAKVASIEIDGLEVGLRYDDLRAVFESQAAFSAQSNVAKRITAALAFVDEGFGSSANVLRNRTVVQSFLTLVCRLMESDKMVGHEKRVAKFLLSFLKELGRQVELGQQATDADFLEFQRTVNANVKTGARIRHQFLVRKLLAFDPGFVHMLDGAAIAESGIRATITQEAAALVRGIAQLNEQYAARHGTNLFKPTNRTAQAQNSIGVPINDFEGYRTLINDLYFLFEEGVGERLAGATPEAFRDINTLRTDLQHDVEHGSKKKVSAKKRAIGKVFAKYAGAPSPRGLEPQCFIVVQANLLGALRGALSSMAVV